jgi:esterase/lipase superfamily enzyme
VTAQLHDLRTEHQEHVHWFSAALERRMDLIWYGHAGRPFLWFPSFQGRYYDPEGFGLIAAVDDLIEAGLMQVACVDSVDAESFGASYLPPAERLARHEQYDRYLAEEAVPWFRDAAGVDSPVATIGVSFGAYHAVNFGFRHPDLVDKVVGLSGKYDIFDFLEGHWDEAAYYHSPTVNIPSMGEDWVGRLSGVDIAIVSGEHDYLVDASRELIAVLESKEIPHRGHVWGEPYGHDWGWWQRQVTHYVP